MTDEEQARLRIANLLHPLPPCKFDTEHRWVRGNTAWRCMYCSYVPPTGTLLSVRFIDHNKLVTAGNPWI